MTRTHLRSFAFAMGAAAVAVAPRPGRAEVFPVDVSQPRFEIYLDPNTGRTVRMGGFSGLAPNLSDPRAELFHTITDRGPNLDTPDGGKAFPDPGFVPSILRLQVRNGARILSELPLLRPDGSPTSGVPSACYTAEPSILDMANNSIARDADGLDTEGLAQAADGSFWISDEYGPSVAHVDAEGHVVLRLVPGGALCGGELIPTMDALPAVFSKRVANRGLEGVAVAPNGRVYSIFQRPLGNPNKAASEASRNIRIVEIDPAKILAGAPGAIRQFLYLTDGSPHRGRYASDIFALSDTEFLVPERRSDKLIRVDLAGATDITGLEDASGTLLAPVGGKTTIEQLTPAELALAGITPAGKTLILAGLAALDPALEKVEGVALSNGFLHFVPDNDFDLTGEADFGTVPATIRFQSPANPPRVVRVPFPSVP